MRRFSPLDVAVFGAILLLGLARLPAPFTGDQALNMLMGKVIADGGAPYVDLWDLKHPGIFFFFAAGGLLFGFNEVGIHLFELLWMLVLALAVRVTAEHFLDNRVAISWPPHSLWASTSPPRQAFISPSRRCSSDCHCSCPLPR